MPWSPGGTQQVQPWQEEGRSGTLSRNPAQNASPVLQIRLTPDLADRAVRRGRILAVIDQRAHRVQIRIAPCPRDRYSLSLTSGAHRGPEQPTHHQYSRSKSPLSSPLSSRPILVVADQSAHRQPTHHQYSRSKSPLSSRPILTAADQ